MSVMRTLETYIFSTTPPRPRELLKRKPTSVPMKVQLSTRTLRTPPDISLPMVNPPCAWYTVQPSTSKSSVGTPIRRPAASLPDLMQMPSSPTSNVQPQITLCRQDSKSSASLFWAVGKLRTCTLRMETVSYTHLRAHETRHDLVC